MANRRRGPGVSALDWTLTALAVVTKPILPERWQPRALACLALILLCCGLCCESIAQRLSSALGVLEDLWPLVDLWGLWFGERRRDDGFAC